MADAELNLLRTAKAAVVEGLLSEDDYSIIKHAFVRAQSIKAGLDAGFIEREDYIEARNTFFNSLNISSPSSSRNAVSKPQDSRSNVIVPNGSSTHQPTQPSQRSSSPSGLSRTRMNDIGKPGSKPGSAPSSPRTESAQLEPATRNASSPLPPQPSQPADTTTADIAVPKMGGHVVDGKKSMSGIRIHPDCINLFNFVKAKKALKWMTFAIDSSGKQVVIERQGVPTSAYEDFLAAFPENECRYAVYDYEYENAAGEKWSKLCFVHWSPDTASVRNKMMYASTKDFFKGFLEGMSADMQASEIDELHQSEMNKHIGQIVARA